MNIVDKNVVKIKNLIGIIDNPTIEDLLFEIANFLSDEQRPDGIFTIKEVQTKTRIRISDDLLTDLQSLENLGYIVPEKTKYKLIKHLW